MGYLYILFSLFSILLRVLLLRTSRNEVMFSGVISFLKICYFFIGVMCMFVCMCVGAHRGQKRASDLLELELHAVTVGARNQT